jgi:phthiocerol/phenolphthiocerol synthesis type-I polyketide synthase D
MKFGLLFFAASESSLAAEKYRLVLESARFGDRAGFSSIWLPERHFTSFGGLYPNPAVLHAALAMCTTTIRLNAGSVVAPLHHPARIAEEWAVVDNLSHGRVGISFAPGWNPDDFLFFPERYATRYEHLFESMKAVRTLWRGEPLAGTNGAGQPYSVTTFPRPVQRELPVWMTVAGNPGNFEHAGASGANLLTHLLDQDETVLASRIALYRRARAVAGFDPAAGEVSLMIHTLVGTDAAVVREQARRPYCEYIKRNIGLFAGLARSRGHEADLSAMAPADLDEFVNFLYDRFAASRGLIGTPESCAPLVSRLEHVGVTELACLLDFGPDPELILSNLPHLARLKDLDRSAPAAASAGHTRTAPAPRFDPAIVRQRCDREISGEEFHSRLARHGIRIDGLFQPTATIWRRDGEAIARLTLTDDTRGYHVHPASLDACCRVLAAALPGLDADDGSTYLPAGFQSCDLVAPLAGTVWIHALITGWPTGVTQPFTGDVRVYDLHGRPLAAIGGIRLTPFERRAELIEASRLLYQRVWRAAPVTDRSTAGIHGRWMVMAGDDEVAAELWLLLEAHGAERATGLDDPDLRGIVYLGHHQEIGSDESAEALERVVERTAGDALALMQASGSVPIWLVTRGAIAELGSGGGNAGPDGQPLAEALLWGMGRVLAVERPGALGSLIDLDPGMRPADSARCLLDVIGGSHDEDMLAFRDGRRLVPRLTRTVPSPSRAPIAFEAADVALITGGVGGLGLHLAGWLAGHGARHLILCSRRAPSAAALVQLERLRSSGVEVIVVQVDVADASALATQLAIGVKERALTSVFHLAGVLDDGRIEGLTWERFAAVLRSKVQGAWNLHQLTGSTALKHFVMFSSVASLMPASGQCSYAAANAFLDALAMYRRGHGLPALSVNWGPWSGAGHAGTDYGRQAHQRLASLGIGSISPGQGLQVLEQLLQQDRAQAIVVSVDWERLFRADAGAGRLGLLAELAVVNPPAGEESRRRPSELVDSLRALPADERRPYILGYLSDMVIAALKLRTDEPLEPRQRLFDVGLDSIMALELKDRLERAVGAKLSATLLFVHPTLDALSSYLLTEIVGTVVEADVPATTAATLSEDELTLVLLREIEASRGA